EIAGKSITPPPCDDDLLGDAESGHFVSVALEPIATPGSEPWELGSPLVFVGWSGSCGIQVKDEAASKIHCAFVRTADAAYLVDFCGRRTRLDGRQVPGASILADGQTLAIGSTKFTVRVVPPKTRKAKDTGHDDAPNLVARVIHPETDVEVEVDVDVDVSSEVDDRVPVETSSDLANVPAEPRHEMIAWMIDTVREAQISAQRQREEMRDLFGEVVRQIQQGNAAILEAHLERIEKIDHELASLRAEFSRHFPTRLPAPPPSPASLPAPPEVAPLRIPRNIPQNVDPNAAATWLLDRVGRLEEENHSAWRDLINRIGALPKNDR
ncbi:FHA domain-containing protein, partial [Singulisphaera rosea]